MKNKFTYIKTIVLLFLCKYNTEHNLTFLFETCGKTENTIHTIMGRSILCLLQIVEGFGTSLESGQPALSDQALYCRLLKFIFLS